MKVRAFSQVERRNLILVVVFALAAAAFSLGALEQPAGAQAKLTLADVLTGLKSTKVTLAERNRLLTDAASKRGVTFALTAEIERELRATGANNTLIAAIRQNGPQPVSTSTPTPSAGPSSRNNAQAVHTRADELFNKNDFAGAIPEYTRALQLDPSRSLAYVRRGFSYNYLGDIDKAFKDYESALQSDPTLRNQPYINCVFYKTGDDPNEVIDKCSVTLAEFTGFSLAYYKRGIAYRDIKNYDLALRDYNEAIRYNPNFGYAYNSRAVIHIDPKKNYSAAVTDASTAIRLIPNFDSAYFNRGLAYFSLGNYDSAMLDFTKVIQLKPNDVDSHFYRGRIYFEQKNYNQAIASFARAISINPNDAEALNYRGICYYYLKDNQAALNDYNESLRIKPSAVKYRNRALVYEAMGRTDLANADRRRAQQYEQQ